MKSIGHGICTVGRSEPRPRAAPRVSMLMMAVLRRPGFESVSVRLRNLSEGGAMAECRGGFFRGERIETEVRGLGVVPGRVVWTTARRLGISFDRPIEPRVAQGAMLQLWQPASSGRSAS